MKNLLAIVIPYYKIEFFEQCLDSLSKQTNKNFNIYIGDDCSPNNPAEIINKYRGLLNLQYHRFPENKGGTSLTKQWERCIELTQDEGWIMLLGDDDLISENLVENFYGSLHEINAGNHNVIRANVTEIDESGKTLRTFDYPKFQKPSTAYIRKITQDYHLSLPEFIFKKTTYQKYGFQHFPYAFGSDEIAWLEFCEGNTIFTLENSYCFMRLSQLSISGSKQDLKRKVYAMYLTKKYIIKKLFFNFSKEERILIISKAYKDLLYADSKLYAERLWFILKTAPYLSLKKCCEIFLKGTASTLPAPPEEAKS